MADEDWNHWLDRHGATLMLLARQWTPSSSDAADLVQEAFLRFWKTRHGVIDSSAYLYACLKRSAVDQYRQNARRLRRERAVAKDESELHWFGPRAEKDARMAEIEAALRDLPADQREVLTMKTWGGLTFEQIGAALEISPSTAASRFRYALEKMRTTLKAKEGVA